MDKVKISFEFGRTLNWEEVSDYSVYSCERNCANKTKFWCAIVRNYKTAKVLDREFLECSNTAGDAIVDMAGVKQGEIIQMRFDERISRKYTDRYEINAFVSSVDEDGLELMFFETLYKAVKYFHGIEKENGAN